MKETVAGKGTHQIGTILELSGRSVIIRMRVDASTKRGLELHFCGRAFGEWNAGICGRALALSFFGWCAVRAVGVGLLWGCSAVVLCMYVYIYVCFVCAYFCARTFTQG